MKTKKLINEDVYLRYLAIGGTDSGEFAEFAAGMGYPESYAPLDVDFDMMLWGMVNNPETAKKFWEMSDEEMAEGLELFADDIENARHIRHIWE